MGGLAVEEFYIDLSVSIIVSRFSFCCTVLWNLLQGWCVPGSLGVDMLHSMGIKGKKKKQGG